ncbi:MAG: hypothetical protein CBC29_08865 [Methylococcaceae bacterium TMED69]|nr:MAG: hypothetical protein CBC29_08865 [Methylococcaceae bacterium TMED69]
MSQSQDSAKQIRKNRRALFEIQGQVMVNKARAYATRSNIEENRYLILKNYVAAFVGNRQLANQNTDDIFENRIAILENIEIEKDNEIQENFIDSSVNKAKVDFLVHRAELNETVLTINQELVEVNQKLIEINEKLLAANELIKNFNGKEIEENKRLLNGGVKPEGATKESNTATIDSNTEQVQNLQEKTQSNSQLIMDLYDIVAVHRQHIAENSDEILSRREGIEENHEKIVENREEVAEMISPSE